MAKNIAATRITKKLLPLQPGAKKLTARYGEALIYVRYRLDPTEDRRYTTVELLGADGPAITHIKSNATRLYPLGRKRSSLVANHAQGRCEMG